MTTKIVPKIMPRDEFYELIERARADTAVRGSSADAKVLKTVMADLENKVVRSYARRYDAEAAALNRWDVRAVGHIITGGLSDFGFTDFRAWLIGKGMAAVDAVLANPDDLADFLPAEPVKVQSTSFHYAMVDAFLARDMKWITDRPVSLTVGESFDEISEEIFALYPKTTAVALAWDAYDDEVKP
jgi:hypothetical protein